MLSLPLKSKLAGNRSFGTALKMLKQDVKTGRGVLMNLRAKLGGAAGILFIGVFYMFAFCMVDDVEEKTIPIEYYYSAETQAFEKETVPIDVEDEEKPETEAVKSAEVHENADFDDISDEDNPEHIEAVPVMAAVTEFDKGEESDEAPSEAEKPVDEFDENLPEDFDVDELSENGTEAQQQEIYAKDSEENDTLYSEDDFEETALYTETETPPETEPLFWETEAPPETAEDNFVQTIFPDETATPADTGVTVTPEAAGSISSNETFTAKFEGSVHTVNAYDLICWIVNNEISESFSDEAIKAQAVAAYSYVKYHNVNGLTPTVLIKRNPSQRIMNMVSSVWGVCCYYNGEVAQTVYMASSSGYTADAKNVWGGYVPYLVSVRCPLDAEYDPNYGSTMTVSESSMRSSLESCLGISLSNNPYNWLTVTGYVDGNYVSDINVDGQKTISGRKLRENVLGYKLKSAAFDVYFDGTNFVFTTYGYGHGVGMSQNGANILGKQGYSYVDILKFYFTGIEVI